MSYQISTSTKFHCICDYGWKKKDISFRMFNAFQCFEVECLQRPYIRKRRRMTRTRHLRKVHNKFYTVSKFHSLNMFSSKVMDR